MALRFVMTELEHTLFSPALASKHRNLDCKRYDKCLDLAIKKNWVSFSCCKCPVFKKHLKEQEKLQKKEEVGIIVRRGVFYEQGLA